jgi:hypothetical protein
MSGEAVESVTGRRCSRGARKHQIALAPSSPQLGLVCSVWNWLAPPRTRPCLSGWGSGGGTARANKVPLADASQRNSRSQDAGVMFNPHFAPGQASRTFPALLFFQIDPSLRNDRIPQPPAHRP